MTVAPLSVSCPWESAWKGKGNGKGKEEGCTGRMERKRVVVTLESDGGSAARSNW